MGQSETDITAVPSSADSWTLLNDFTVPANVKRLMMVVVAVAPDWSTTAGSVRAAPILRLTGSGLQEQSPHAYLGMFAASSTVTTGGCAQSNLSITYMVDIPVSTGGIVTAELNTLDEAITAGSVEIALHYDENSPTASNSMSDYVDVAGTTTADAFATVGTFTVPQPSTGTQPKRIRSIYLGVAPDQGTSAISLRTASRFRLTGSGIVEQGNHEFVGPISITAHIGSSASQGAYPDNLTIRYDVDIPVSPGGQILAEHIFDVETPTASTVAVGLLYD